MLLLLEDAASRARPITNGSLALAITHNEEEARFVSSCFSCPSNAKPLLSLLYASSGVRCNTLDKVNPGPTGQPSLWEALTLSLGSMYNFALFSLFKNIKLHTGRSTREYFT